MGRFGVLTLSELELACKAESKRYIVEGLIPVCSVCIAVGDSGLGKSPWAYQLAISVATGVPFLGQNVAQGKVLYIDLENGAADVVDLCRSLSSHLKLGSPPNDSLFLLSDRDNLIQLEAILEEYAPDLVIIDSLRAYSPDAEDSNKNASALLNRLRAWARKYKTAFLLIHHLKKPGDFGYESLEDTNLMNWLLQSCGARALINQSDVRIGFDVRRGAKRAARSANENGSAADEVHVVVKGFARLRGQFGPMFLTRCFDEEGDPLGYRCLSGIELLNNDDQETAYRTLPVQFPFKQAKQVYGRDDQPTTDFLQKCIRVGILKRPRRGWYVKAEQTE